MFTHNFVGLDLDRCWLVDPPADGTPTSLIWSGGADRLLATVRFEPAGCHAQRPPPLLAAQADPLLEHWNSLAHSLCRQLFQDLKTEIV